jgi:5'-3' exonuclease
VQVPVIEQVLDALGLCRMGIADYEADDVIGTLATTAGCAVDVVTGDRDLFQLVRDDQPVRIVYTAKGVGQASAWDEAAVTAKYGIPGRSYGEFATLRGDASDGLPGVPGVGEKTAAALVTRFGSVEEIVAAAATGSDEGFPAGARGKVLAAADYLTRAPAVVRVVCDIDLPDHDDRLRATPKDPEALLALSERWNLEASGAATATWSSRSISCFIQRTKSPGACAMSTRTWSSDAPRAHRHAAQAKPRSGSRRKSSLASCSVA